MDVSKNRGTPKWMVYNGNLVKWMTWGYHYFWKDPYGMIPTTNFPRSTHVKSRMQQNRWTLEVCLPAVLAARWKDWLWWLRTKSLDCDVPRRKLYSIEKSPKLQRTASSFQFLPRVSQDSIRSLWFPFENLKKETIIIYKPWHTSCTNFPITWKVKVSAFASPSFAGLHFQLPPTIGLVRGVFFHESPCENGMTGHNSAQHTWGSGLTRHDCTLVDARNRCRTKTEE